MVNVDYSRICFSCVFNFAITLTVDVVVDVTTMNAITVVVSAMYQGFPTKMVYLCSDMNSRDIPYRSETLVTC